MFSFHRNGVKSVENWYFSYWLLGVRKFWGRIAPARICASFSACSVPLTEPGKKITYLTRYYFSNSHQTCPHRNGRLHRFCKPRKCPAKHYRASQRFVSCPFSLYGCLMGSCSCLWIRFAHAAAAKGCLVDEWQVSYLAAGRAFWSDKKGSSSWMKRSSLFKNARHLTHKAWQSPARQRSWELVSFSGGQGSCWDRVAARWRELQDRGSAAPGEQRWSLSATTRLQTPKRKR